MSRSIRVCVVLAAAALVGCGGGSGPEPAPVATEAATASATVASADGVKIAYEVHRIDQPNLVLVHGWMCDRSYWDKQVPALAEGFGVVTVDLAGHGESGLDRRTWSIASLAGDVETVVEALDLDDVIVVGHSMGGLVALDAARRMPERVIGVIGVDTLHDADPELDPEELAPMFAGFEQDFAAACDSFVRGMFVDGTDPELVDRVAADMCGGPAEVGLALLRAYVEYDWPRGFSEAGVPIRSINSDMWPTDLEGNRQVADYDATILEGRGHFLMQEAPDELAAALIDTALEIAAAEDGPKR